MFASVVQLLCSVSEWLTKFLAIYTPLMLLISLVSFYMQPPAVAWRCRELSVHYVSLTIYGVFDWYQCSVTFWLESINSFCECSLLSRHNFSSNIFCKCISWYSRIREKSHEMKAIWQWLKIAQPFSGDSFLQFIVALLCGFQKWGEKVKWNEANEKELHFSCMEDGNKTGLGKCNHNDKCDQNRCSINSK